MKQADEATAKRRWRWPQFSLWECLLTVTVLAGLWSILALREDADELVGSILGSLVLVWCLVCWRTIRLNSPLFKIRKKNWEPCDQPRTPDQETENE